MAGDLLAGVRILCTMRLFNCLLISLCLPACHHKKEYPAPPAPVYTGSDTGVRPTPPPVANINANTPPPVAPAMEEFRNIEQVEYCVLLPLQEYRQAGNTGTRARHEFVHIKKKDDHIIVQGFFRSDTKMPLEEYYTNSYKDAGEEGKIIETRTLLKEKNCFWFTGYWSNMVYKSRFVEIVWLRGDEMVNYTANFDIKDTAVWKQRLPLVLAKGSACTN